MKGPKHFSSTQRAPLEAKGFYLFQNFQLRCRQIIVRSSPSCWPLTAFLETCLDNPHVFGITYRFTVGHIPIFPHPPTRRTQGRRYGMEFRFEWDVPVRLAKVLRNHLSPSLVTCVIVMDADGLEAPSFASELFVKSGICRTSLAPLPRFSV